MSEVKETKKTKEKPFDITKEKYKVKLDRNQVGEENFLYVCNGARGVQVKRGIDVTVPFAVREAIRMAEDLAEPAVHVLNKQVEDITGGLVSKRSMLIALSVGVGLSIGLSMIRIIVGFPIIYSSVNISVVASVVIFSVVTSASISLPFVG